MSKILTGIKPTGDQLHVGNYFGAVKQLLDYQEQNNNIIFAFIANMHGMTQIYDSKLIRDNTINVLKGYLSCGLDPTKTIIFKHSDVVAHAQLNRIFACITNIGFMKRMHAFKDALNKGIEEDISMGTFNYPILMAADILLYDPDFVPVGKDQKQHVEFARDIGQKFNSIYGDTFHIPDVMIKKEVAVVPGIDGRKMSKSYNNFLGIFDDLKLLEKKIKQIVTQAIPVEDPKDPDQCNIYNILKLFLNPQEDQELRTRYVAGGLSFKEVKTYLSDKLLAFLLPIQNKLHNITDEYVTQVLIQGAEQANIVANLKIQEIYRKVGFCN